MTFERFFLSFLHKNRSCWFSINGLQLKASNEYQHCMIYMSRIMGKPAFAYAKTNALISSFVFATYDR